MAGRLPGVGLSPRKRSENYHNRHEHYVTYRDSSYLRESLETPWTSMTTTLDESAFKAKQRLQKKLGYSPRSIEQNPKKEGKESKSKFNKKDTGLGRKLLESSWLLRGNKFKKDTKVCAVCLEDFHQDEQVMNLSCSHKYHSACLIPWLEKHPHCPYCRTMVVPSD